MCLALPGMIIEIESDPESPFVMAVCDFGGVRRRICVDTVEDPKAGDYVVAHAGVAISLMDKATALATIADLETLASNRHE